MRRRGSRVLRGVVAFALATLAAVGVISCAPEQAHAYTYLKTNTVGLFSRAWISVNPSEDGYLEMIGSDPWGPRPYMPSVYAPNGESDYYVAKYEFPTWSAAGGQDDLVWHRAWSGSWTRAGGIYGTGRIDGKGQGNVLGSYASYGYGYGGNDVRRHGGYDALICTHVYVGGIALASMTWYPKVTISYNANTSAAVGGMPATQRKYIGNALSLSAARPTRTGYTFEGWSTSRNGPVNIAAGQRVGSMDWNLENPIYMGHDWYDGKPQDWWHDASYGTRTPTGTNKVVLYAQWRPVTYSVSYRGNGATGGSTAVSSHVYDAAKPLTSNGFTRSYMLACDARGGSAGMVSKPCSWRWTSWNTQANGGGASYANGTRVRNLRSAGGTVVLHAQWASGTVVLPSPGSKEGHVFEGWYTAAEGGAFAGAAGAAVTIDRNTTLYAHWKRLARVSYCVDGSSNPVYAESVDAGAAYSTSLEAVRLGTKQNCAGFDGWYADAACTQPYVDGSAAPEGDMILYGRNKVRLEFALADSSKALFADRACYADEAATAPLVAGPVLPQPQTHYYGERVAVAREAGVWLEERGRMRQAVCDAGAYASPEAMGSPASTLRLTGNAVAYLRWRIPAYDGIEVS